MTKKEIDSILIMADSYDRFQTFLELVPVLKGKKYWYALRKSYQMSDNLFHCAGLVKAAFIVPQPNREYLMTPKEIKSLQQLPESFTIYRGMTEQELKTRSFGVSWSLKKEVAEYFAYTYGRNFATTGLKKVVYAIRINKSDVIAFFDDREEFEIIYIHPGKRE